MPRPVGPTIPRWQLGEELSRLRKKHDCSKQHIAARLRCSVSKIEKIEAGSVKMNFAELEAMLTEYELPRDDWSPLLELQRLGAMRGWWARFGQLPVPFTQFLGLETAAVTIRTFDLSVVPGLYQTEAYAAALAVDDSVGMTEEEVDQEVNLKLARQKQILGDDQPEQCLLLDESVLHRQVGGATVLRGQLDHLIETAKHTPIQIVPYDTGSYPGTRGSFVIFDFPEELHSPVVYVEGQGGNLYLEKSEDLRRCNLTYQYMLGAALSRPKSVALMKDVARRIE